MSAVVADEQSLEVVQPGEGALDDPAVPAELPGGRAPAASRSVPATAPMSSATATMSTRKVLVRVKGANMVSRFRRLLGGTRG
jgi:hypothetical protein